MTLEEMADRLEAKPSQWPTLEKSVAHRERDGETCPNAPELTVSDKDSELLTLRRRIQNSTMSLSEDIRGVGHQTLQPGVSDRIV